jgi:hypothetical protein
LIYQFIAHIWISSDRLTSLPEELFAIGAATKITRSLSQR